MKDTALNGSGVGKAIRRLRRPRAGPPLQDEVIRATDDLFTIL